MSTFAFFPEGAFGPTNNCVGIGAVLRARGHRVVFIVEESFAGTLEAQGFEERLMRLGPEPEVPEEPGQFWKDFVRDTAQVFREPTVDQLEGFVAPTMRALVEGAMYVDERLRELLDELRPDVVAEDNVCAFPALAASGRPWVRIASCHPGELHDPDVPPPFSGYPAADRSGWAEYWREFDRAHAELHAEFNAFCVDRGAPALAPREFLHTSPWANIYAYPDELDYPRARSLPGWTNVQASVRDSHAGWELPAALRDREGPLVYLSLGSLGAADVPLMQRLIDELDGAPVRVVVSLGPQHDQLRLGDAMTGEEFLPQTAVLPAVDAVITHGGNNTVLEGLLHGKPMVVLPLFWDQHDNAQRLDETGFGVRLATYAHEPAELTAAIAGLLADEAMAARRQAVARRLQAAPGTVTAADVLERVARGA